MGAGCEHTVLSTAAGAALLADPTGRASGGGQNPIHVPNQRRAVDVPAALRSWLYSGLVLRVGSCVQLFSMFRLARWVVQLSYRDLFELHQCPHCHPARVTHRVDVLTTWDPGTTTA